VGKDKDILAKSLEVIDSGDKYASSHLLYQLSGLSSNQMGSWSKVWPQLDVARRTHIITRLVELAEDDFTADFNAVFRQALTDSEPQVRARAIEGLWEDESPDLVFPLLRMVNEDDSPLVRAKAATALGRYVLLGELEELDVELANAITESLFSVIARKDQTTEVRRRAIEAVSYSGDKRTRDVILRAYHDPDEKMQASAIFAMGRSADPYWQGTVVLELDNPNPVLRYEAACAAGELESPLATQSLIRLLDDPDREVRQMAMWSLGQIGGPEAREALIRCLDEEDDELLREAAEDALAELELSDGEWPSLLFSIE